MEFIEDGVSLNDLFKDPAGSTRLLRDDISDDEVEIIYRQVSGFLLQLWNLDIGRIGNLEPPSPELCFSSRPLTRESHDILQTGGIDTIGAGLHKEFACSY